MRYEDSDGYKNFVSIAHPDTKPNNTPKAKKLKQKLELLGHTNVFVWWEQLGGAAEMCGPEGGYFYVSDQESHCPIGYSFAEADEYLNASTHQVKK